MGASNASSSSRIQNATSTGSRLAAGAAQVGLEGVAEAAVGVLVAAQRVEHAFAGTAPEQRLEAQPVDQPAVQAQIVLRLVDDVHEGGAPLVPAAGYDGDVTGAGRGSLVRIGRLTSGRTPARAAVKGREAPCGIRNACSRRMRSTSHSPSVMTRIGASGGKSSARSSRSTPGWRIVPPRPRTRTRPAISSTGR